MDQLLSQAVIGINQYLREGI